MIKAYNGKQLYLVTNRETGELETGCNGYAVPKLYTIGSAKALVTKRNKMFKTSKWEIIAADLYMVEHRG